MSIGLETHLTSLGLSQRFHCRSYILFLKCYECMCLCHSLVHSKDEIELLLNMVG